MGMMFRSAASLIVCAGLSACGSPQRNEQPLSTGQNINFTERKPQGFATWQNAPQVYRVGPGDKLKIKFLMTQELDEEVTVAPDGFIAVRSAGQLKVEGRSVRDIERMIHRASSHTVANQQLVVSLEEAVSSKIYVGGSVNQPGTYRFDNMHLSAVQAVVLAGGFSNDARLGQVAVIRRGPHGKPMLRTIDVKSIIQSGGTCDVPLQAGDILYVPRSSVGELNLWVSQFIEGVVPFQRSFSYTIGTYRTNTGGFIP